MIYEHEGKLFATARAYIVDAPEELPRELASAIGDKSLNPGFVWIAGRYVQANSLNRNGQYWTFDDLKRGEASIRHTPVNLLHDWQKPVGTIVETKMIHREEAVDDKKQLLPEIQALAVLWATNFPEEAAKVKAAHAEKTLWWSMECLAESKQCLTCELIFPFRAAAHEICEHLATSRVAPRRFINPVFLGGGLIFPPDRPGWKDADITDLATELSFETLQRVLEWSERAEEKVLEVSEWEHLMALATKR